MNSYDRVSTSSDKHAFCPVSVAFLYLFVLVLVLLAHLGQPFVLVDQESVLLLQDLGLLVVVVVHLHAQVLAPVHHVCAFAGNFNLLTQIPDLLLELEFIRLILLSLFSEFRSQLLCLLLPSLLFPLHGSQCTP